MLLTQTASPMVTQHIPDVQAPVRLTACRILPPAAATKWAEWGSNPRTHGAMRLRYHSADSVHMVRTPYIWSQCCLGAHLPLTKNPNCVYLTDCLLAGSGTDWLTVNLSSRCTAEGNRILIGTRIQVPVVWCPFPSAVGGTVVPWGGGGGGGCTWRGGGGGGSRIREGETVTWRPPPPRETVAHRGGCVQGGGYQSPRCFEV